MPGITPLAKQVLQARGIHTVRDLTGAFRRDTYTGCHALESQSLVLKQRAQALRYGKIFDVQRETHRMGAAASEPILVVAERDPITRLCFAVGMRCKGGGSETWIATDGTPKAEREMLCGWLAALGEQASGASVLVWDAAEWSALGEAMDRHGRNPVLQRLLAPVLGVLAPGDDAPLIVLHDVVADLFALPIPYGYDLPSVSGCLLPSEAPHVHSASPDWQDVRRAWEGDAGARSTLESALSSKLDGLHSVLRAVRECSERRGKLRQQPARPKAAIATEPLAHPELEALRVATRMESAAQSAWIRALHALPAEQRARRWECIRGMELCERRSDGMLVFEFDPECRDAKFRPGDFDLLVTNEGTDGLAEAGRDPWRARALAMELIEYDLAADPPRVVLSRGDGLAKAEEKGWINLNRRCVLDRAGSDWNTPRILATLGALDAGQGESAAVLEMLQGEVPAAFKGCRDVEAVWYALQPSLNADQQRAWRAALEQPVSLIWGPPGTGKTHLLASVLLGLVRAGRRRILASAATHRAIVNLLARLDPSLSVVKLAGSGSAADADLVGTAVQVIPDAHLPALLAGDEPVIVGSTVWSLWKQMRDAGKKQGAGP
ncbi:MAG: AAA family ATPase, partial [Gemmatimonadota bacterium]|nr:AAA family ATPase [Gemmatimonadota bacterium]